MSQEITASTELTDRMGEMIDELQQAVVQLRSQELAPEQIGTLIERCAELATEASLELERRARATASNE